MAQALQQQGMRLEVDASGDRLGKQIRATELERIPVVAVIGFPGTGSVPCEKALKCLWDKTFEVLRQKLLYSLPVKTFSR